MAEHFHSGVLPPPLAACAARVATKVGYNESPGKSADFISTWMENRGGTAAVIVKSNKTGSDFRKGTSCALTKSAYRSL